jgi:hypothetical protein
MWSGAIGLGGLLLLVAACGSDRRSFDSDSPPSGNVPAFGDGGPGASDGNSVLISDPTTCAEAAASKTYVGCDFWPTVVDNIVRPTFDYAVVVANTNAAEAAVEVLRGTTKVGSATVPANGLATIYLPWVPELKAMGVNPVCETMPITKSVKVKSGAYHLTSTVPVAVYQFNAIEYTNKGGPPGKDWSTCSNGCIAVGPCFSFSNDASLLLPSTALTGNYRVAGLPAQAPFPAYFAVTGTSDGTAVTVKLGPDAKIAAGGGISGSGTVTFTLDAGEVAEVIGTETSDFSGTLVTSSAPVQVITGMACTENPRGKKACDHVEESVLPVETLGKRYFVTAPTSPKGAPASHTVRLYGNVDGTKLTFLGAKPSGAPTTIDAGKTVDLGLVDGDFELVADHELTVASTQVGAGAPGGEVQGDPSYSFMSSVEQYRVKYVFLGPSDYDTNWADVVQPMDATLTLDGAPVTTPPKAIASGYGVTRIKLGPGKDGAHVLTASAPVGLQVLGYGAYTSYQYAGGLNLGRIAPVPIK